MNTKHRFLLAIALLAIGSHAWAQQQCSAAFLNNKMVVNEYTTKGKCILSQQASGKLTVCTANLSPKSSTPVDKIAFQISIRDGKTKSLCSFSKQTYQQIDIQKILAKCKKGDFIVLRALGSQYALPHNEILVN
ncbi:MAG: hypothetical protein U0Y10_12500 [Spirosomataceae bacterium]